MRWRPPVVILALAAACAAGFDCAPLAAPARADAPDSAGPGSVEARFLEGLRQRRLFTLAQAQCQQWLNRDDLPPAHRAELVIELIRVYTLHALHSPPAARADYWSAARAAVHEFGRLHPKNPRLIVARAQVAYSALALAELSRREAEIADAPAAWEAAREALRQALRPLELLDLEIDQIIPTRAGDAREEGQLAPEELRALQHQLRAQVARALVNRGLCYPPGSADRVNALTAALEQQAKLLRQLPANDPAEIPLKLEQAVARRLLGDLDAAETTLRELLGHPKLANQGDVAGHVLAELARARLESGGPDRALELFAEHERAWAQKSAEFDHARLEASVAKWKRAAEANSPDAARWQQKSLALVKVIEQRHGPYWRQLADGLLARVAGDSGGPANLEILARAAERLYGRGHLEDAVAAYDRAVEQAERVGESDKAFVWAYQAALILHGLKRHAEAGQRLREAALARPGHPHAAKAHLLGLWNTARLAEADPAVLGDYVARLEEHLSHWPQGAAADQARLWLGRQRQQQGDLAAASRLYLEISKGAAAAEEAQAAAAECVPALLAALAEAEPARLAAEAARWAELFERHAPPPGAAAGDWTPAARRAAVSAARARLLFTPDGHATAAALLERVPPWAAADDQALRGAAQTLLVAALAAQPQRRADAERVLAELSAGPPRDLLTLARELRSAARAAPPAARAELWRLALAAADKLAPARDKLAPSERAALALWRAEALAELGRRSEASKLFEQLAREQPRDGAAQESYARFLAAGTSPEERQAALRQWRLVAAHAPPRSPRWGQAKLGVAEALAALGDYQAAADLIEYLQATPPGLADSPWNADFERLLRHCRDKGAKKP